MKNQQHVQGRSKKKKCVWEVKELLRVLLRRLAQTERSHVLCIRTMEKRP